METVPQPKHCQHHPHMQTWKACVCLGNDEKKKKERNKMWVCVKGENRVEEEERLRKNEREQHE